MIQSHQRALEEQFQQLPLETQECIESMVLDLVEKIGDEGFRVSHGRPADKLAQAIMQYIYDVEHMLYEEQALPHPSLILINEGNC